MTSIDTNNPTRDDDLRSTNFFEVDQYPQMSYRSTGVQVDGERVILDGELTAHGVTHPVPLRVEVNGFGADRTATRGAASPPSVRSTAAISG